VRRPRARARALRAPRALRAGSGDRGRARRRDRRRRGRPRARAALRPRLRRRRARRRLPAVLRSRRVPVQPHARDDPEGVRRRRARGAHREVHVVRAQREPASRVREGAAPAVRGGARPRRRHGDDLGERQGDARQGGAGARRRGRRAARTLTRPRLLRLRALSADEYVRDVLPHSRALWAGSRTDDEYAGELRAIASSAWGKRRFRMLGLVVDGVLVASCKRYERELRCGDRAFRAAGIGAVFTPEHLRGRGYATALLGAFLDAERDAGADLAYLFSDVRPAFYER